MADLPSRQSSIALSHEVVATLRALPEPGAELVMERKAIRATDLVDRGLAGYPALTILEECGYARSNRGWWRKTPAGVFKLREIDREERDLAAF